MGRIQQIQYQINLYHILFLVCLGICIICFFLSAVFFFQFEIWNIFHIHTGRSVRMSMKKIEERNSGIELPDRLTEPLTEIRKEIEITAALDFSERESVIPENVQKETDESFGVFQIEKYILLIHTDELI